MPKQFTFFTIWYYSTHLLIVFLTHTLKQSNWKLVLDIGTLTKSLCRETHPGTAADEPICGHSKPKTARQPKRRWSESVFGNPDCLLRPTVLNYLAKKWWSADFAVSWAEQEEEPGHACCVPGASGLPTHSAAAAGSLQPGTHQEPCLALELLAHAQVQWSQQVTPDSPDTLLPASSKRKGRRSQVCGLCILLIADLMTLGNEGMRKTCIFPGKPRSTYPPLKPGKDFRIFGRFEIRSCFL